MWITIYTISSLISIKNNKHIEHFYDFQALIIVNNIIPRGS